VAELAARGATRAVGIVLAPHYSASSVGQYVARAEAAGAEHGIAVVGIEHWHLEPSYIEFLASALLAVRAEMPPKHHIVFTAHSLPERALVGDAYADELRETATAVAERVGLSPWSEWSLAWQSAGRTPEPWRGPDILEVIRDLGATGRSAGVVVCAQGFTSDHLEVLYDLDIEARAAAADVGLEFARTRSLNDDPVVMGALADLIVRTADAAGA
jgi:protoporphyrin/coproporphyrin ferrochelatase